MFHWRLFLFCGFFLCAFLLRPGALFAASLYIDPFQVDVLKGDTVTVAVRLDTDEGECVNTVDAVMSYGEGIQVVDVSRGKSILPLWVEEPRIDKNARRVTFAGGIPNGYCGRIPGDPSLTNILAELVLRAPGFSVGQKENASAVLQFEPESHVYLNDGAGTLASLRTIPGTINLIQQVGSSSQDTWRDSVLQDTTLPQPFSIELVQDSSVAGGKYYIVFNTTDKQSGIDHYEVIEESRKDIYAFKWGRADAPWEEVKSPYVLKDQTLSSVIRVKALDKAGNARITVLIPDDTERRLGVFTWVLLSVVVTLSVGLVALLSFVLYRWLKKRKQNKEKIANL